MNAIDVLIHEISKPLKRPATRACIVCEAPYKSSHPRIADPMHGCCSDICLEELNAIVEDYKRYG